MSNGPFITVLMPVFNADSYVRESIESVLNQTYRSFEFLIINDHSTDNSEEMILGCVDARIQYLKNAQNLGVSVTANRGIDLARGKYIVRLDADDIALPERVERQVSFMESHPDVGVSGTRAEVFGTTKGSLNYDTEDALIRINMLYECHMLQPSIIIRKELIDKHGIRYNPAYVVAEDYDLFYRIGKHAKLANLPEALVRYRKHATNISVANRKLQHEISAILVRLQFADMGIEISDHEIAVFTDVMNSRFDFKEEELRFIESLLLAIIEANRKSGFIPAPDLEKILTGKWKDLLMNDKAAGFAVLGLARRSPLSRPGSFSALEKLKLLIKLIIWQTS